MDPSFVKKLLDDDEVESMHSGAVVEAFTAALNRDIGMDVAAPSISQPLDPPGTRYFLNPRFQYSESMHNEGKVIQETIDVIRRLSRSAADIVKAEREMEFYRLHTGTYEDSEMQFAVMMLSLVGALATDSNSTSNEPIGEWQACGLEDHAIHQTLQQEEQKDLQTQEQHSSQVEQTKHTHSVTHQHLIDSQSKSNHEKLIVQQESLSTDQHQLQKGQAVEKNLVSVSQENYVHESEQDNALHSESQQKSLSKLLNDHQTSTSDQANNLMRRTKSGSIPFNVLIPILRPHLDKDKNMQLEAVFAKLRSNEISKENFLRVIRNIVGDQMLRQAAQRVQIQIAARNSQVGSSQHQLQASQQQFRGAMQFVEGQSISQLHSLSSVQHQRGQTSPAVSQFVEVHMQIDGSTANSNEVDNQSDSQGHHPGQVAHTSMNAVKEEREVSLVSIQAVNKQQQHSMHPPSSVASLYGGKVNTFNSHMLPRPPGTSSVASRKSQAQDSQIRQLTPQGIVSTQSVASLPMNVMNASKYEVQNIATETNRHGGSVSHFTSHLHPQQSQVTWQSSAIKEQKSSTTIGLSTLSVVKQEVSEQTGEQQSRPQFPALQGSFGTMHIDQASPAPSSSKDETVEKQASKITFSASTSTVMTTQMPGSMTSQLESGLQIRSQIPSAAPLAAAGTSTRTPQKKPSVGQKKPLETQATPPSASKKQKVSGAYLDQSIEQLNDVTAVSGVNLREEEEQLLSAPKEESRASEATRRVVQEEEERLILQKAPLQRKLVEIMSKCGIKNINTDVERCISLSVEERLRGLISNLIRVSRQRVDIEKARHRIVFTSDVRRQILMMSKKAKEEWEKKQAEEAEKLRKQNESEGNAGTDAEKEKDEGGRSKPLKATKEEDDKMRTTAANVAARAAVGGDDMLSKWQLMAEQARQKREGGLDTISGTQPERTSSRKPSSNFGRASREVQEAEKKGPSVASAAGSMRKFGRIILQPKVVCSISTKDVVSILEREPQMAKSALIYRLYERVTGNFPTE